MSPRQKELLKEDFNICMGYYDCTAEEAAYEKTRVLANIEEAAKCYSIIAAGIRGLNNV